MTLVEKVVDCLESNGTDTVFGIPGTQTLLLNRAIEADDTVQFAMARHETAIPHMAWGYTVTSTGMAATLVIPGPGDLNAANGIKNALNDCVPLLHLTVETETTLRGGDAIHEIEPETYDNVVKTNITVDRAASAIGQLQRAIEIARIPPQGPVRVGIPRDFITETVLQVAIEQSRPRGDQAFDTGAIDRAATLLSKAATPFILAGGGGRRADASPAVRRLAETLDTPVVTTTKGKAVVPESHDLSAGVLSPAPEELGTLLSEADVALVVGSDLDALGTGNWSAPLPDELIHVTATPGDVGRGYEPTVAIVSDLGTVLPPLQSHLSDHSGDTDGAERAGAVRRARARRVKTLPDSEHLLSADVIDTTAAVLPDDAILTADGGGLQLWMGACLQLSDDQTYMQPGSWATMGSAVPSAMGAALAAPDRDTVALVGDGGLLMSVRELHTIASEDVPVVTVACNNDGYAIISESARANHALADGFYDWDQTPIALADVARGMGMAATRVDSEDGLRSALQDGLAADKPQLIEVMTEPNEPQALQWFGQ
ncbi:MAG: acetolactate synthase-1/2/3 large subunit [Natronomonas sp.]|jgi:acetolactate synthase-1/2/3 large subunit